MNRVEVIELYRRGVARNFFKCGPTNFFPSKMIFFLSKLDSFSLNFYFTPLWLRPYSLNRGLAREKWSIAVNLSLQLKFCNFFLKMIVLYVGGYGQAVSETRFASLSKWTTKHKSFVFLKHLKQYFRYIFQQ